MTPVRVVAPSALLLVALGSAPPAASPALAGSTAPAAAAPELHVDALAHLEIALSDLPVEIHRRAVDHLELGRERQGSTWVDARLAPHALPMFRPGDDAPTYYELRVVGPDGEPRGFFVLSATEDDHPVPLSVDEGVPRSMELAAGTTRPHAIARVHYLSPTSLVAESAGGGLLAQLGELPSKVLAAEEAWLSEPEAAHAGSAVWEPTADGEGRLTESLPERRIELGAWSSWAELRRDYAGNYAVLHEVMRRNAADDWEDERDFRRLGEGLQSGWFREIALLDRGGATIDVRGDGRDLVKVQRMERALEGDEAVAVFVPPIDREGVFEVDVDVAYADGTKETHRFAVTRALPGDVLGSLPVHGGGALGSGELPSIVHAELAAPTVTAVAAPECSKAVIRSHHNTYVFARNGGGSTLEARGGWIGSWEIFRIEKAGANDRIALRAPNGKYVEAIGGGGGNVRVTASAVGTNSKFRRVRYADGRVAFRTAGGRYLRAMGDGIIDAVATTPNDWEKYTLEYCSPERLDSAWAGNDPIDAWKKVRKYDQLKGGQAPNKAPCASGCGATVWAMVFGWGDHMAKLGDRRWSASGGLYRRNGAKTGPDDPAPEWMWTDMPATLWSDRSDGHLHDGVGNMIEEIRSYLDDWGVAGCTVTGSRFTAPHIMAQAYNYIKARSVPATLTAEYDGLGIMTNAGKQNALRPIRDHHQVVGIGIGHLSHYPVAFGWEDARFAAWDPSRRAWAGRTRHARFVVHMGWDHAGASNVPFDS